MINRIRLLRNVGQFDSVDSAANFPLARLTVVYSENGRGKTTLAAILRSLATGDPIPIAERERLSGQGSPHVVLECNGEASPAVFLDNAWTRTFPNLLVFDDVFVEANVHSGLAVGSHHRQKLHELILGPQAVAQHRRLQTLVERIEAHNSELRTKASAIVAAYAGPYSADDFCSLPERADIDEAIEATNQALAAAAAQNAIRDAPAMELFGLPTFDSAAIEGILQRDLPALDGATLQRVQAHLAGLGQGGEAWVAEGMRRLPPEVDDGRAGICPFCAQDLRTSPVLQHYRAYFSQEYAALKREVSEAIEAISRSQGGDVQAGFERAVRVVVERRQFWSRFCEMPDFGLDTAAILRDWTAARDAITALLSAKQAAPLERIPFSADVRTILATYETHLDRIATLNQQLQEANQAISDAKERATTANAAVLADDLARLRAIKARHSPEIAPLCEDYLGERAAKAATEQLRDQVKAELEQHRAAVFPAYETSINLYLQRFNAGFRIGSVTSIDTRGGPSCTYNVVINNMPVPIAGGDLSRGDPSFGTTLSSGDRNTLALAFFFASLDHDGDLAQKVVVIDDPISSLDEHRGLTTVQEIRRLSERCNQVIVMSHNKPFLCRLWEGADRTSRTALLVSRDASGSTINLWNISEDSITEHDRRHARLVSYRDSGLGDRRETAQSIRPHLEAFLRVAYPGQFPPETRLGNFFDVCEQRLGTTDQILDQAEVQELRELIEFANKFQHDTNPAWGSETINDAELGGFVRRTLAFATRG